MPYFLFRIHNKFSNYDSLTLYIWKGNMVNGVPIPNQLKKCNTSYRLKLHITLIPWGGLGSSIAVKKSSQCVGHVCLTTVKLHNYIKYNILIRSRCIIHYRNHRRVPGSTVDLYWSTEDYIHTYISVEAITDCKAVYISHNLISSILIESIPLYRDITYYRNFVSVICESG